jgi:hypothetical protein
MTILRSAVVGAKWGLIVATLLCVWVAVLALLSGSWVFTNRSGASYHAGTIIALYLCGGIATGVIIGALRGLLRWRIGAVAVGAIAVLPFGAGIFATRTAFAPWGHIETISLIIFAIAFGGGGGLIVREFVRNEERL